MRGMDDRYALTLDDVYPHCCSVEKDVHQVVVEQVDLVHVEKVAVGLGQHAGLEATGAGLHRRLDVDGADQPVLV